MDIMFINTIVKENEGDIGNRIRKQHFIRIKESEDEIDGYEPDYCAV